MRWIFILNDLVSGNSVVPAQDIADYLLGKKVWQYSSSTSNISKISKGDTVLIYLAGKGRRYFHAEFETQEQIKSIDSVPAQGDKWEKDFNESYKLGSSIEKIAIFDRPVALDESLRQKLSFIGDKKNWGLYFRRGVIGLSDQDYQLIIAAKK